MSGGIQQPHNRKNPVKKKDTFPSKHIKHDPNAESARAVFGKNNPEVTSTGNQK